MPDLVTTDKLCETCRQVSPFTVSTVIPMPDGCDEFRYRHLTLEALQQSAKSCPLCHMIARELNRGDEPIDTAGTEQRVILYCDVYPTTEYGPRHVGLVIIQLSDSNRHAYLQAFAETGSEAASSGDVDGRPLHQHADSDESFHQISKWVNDCMQHHPACASVPLASGSLANEFPSRLLDVGADESSTTCILVNRADARGEYVALSYCWGPLAQQLRTLNSNLVDHMTSINLNDMPLTLRQAVVATRKLGQRYLWIDALCIVQDDGVDWKREAPQMGLIYQNAYCTLAAAGSSTSTGGLFHRRDSSAAAVIKIDYHPPSRKESTRSWYLTPQANKFQYILRESAWNSRGWVLQERNLARRIVLFAAGQTFFECIHHSIGEDGLTYYDHSEKRYGSAEMRLGHDWIWCGIVRDYTARHLTYGDDKLFAIEGMAKNLAARTGKRFCAGLCVSALPMHVMWLSAVGGMSRPVWKDGTQVKRAPSWSWAALEGPVMWEGWVSKAKTACQLEIIGDISGLAPDDVRVRDARLSFQGLTVEVERSLQTVAAEGLTSNVQVGGMGYTLGFHSHTACFVLRARSGNLLGWAVFDKGRDDSGPFIAAVVSQNSVMGTPDKSGTGSYNVVILKHMAQVGSERHYIRVGAGELTHLSPVEFHEQRLGIL
ncbi:heterokaryon incompatibility protein-domain-containing protein [Lasiosphaeria hispida]|uniref:Heterokaryon incompatibility protein-domain-containing protein n=1 Tax=Lasiosphaeria hispida TaxID=260671 RepID=A0AAJ0HKT5_9PEZI|nr:heterokaryon incompatibility protein-domain-containing protein [Lasiosphaeria hispida]